MIVACPAIAEPPSVASLPVPEARWTSPDADLVRELTTAPAECLALPADPEERRAVEIGRAAFRTPSLLGGQAARAGLSCASCHREGRGDEAFSFPGVSGAPGTADVTSSFFSSHRGDGEANPVLIPDLAADPATLKLDRGPGSGAIETFVRGLIIEEFDGVEPRPEILYGLLAYLRAIEPAACPAEARAPITAEGRLADARRAVEAALSAEDADAAILLLSSARAELGRIHARYAAPELAGLRGKLEASDRALAAAQAALRAREDPRGRLAAWRTGLDALAPELIAAEPASLFDADVLSRALAE